MDTQQVLDKQPFYVVSDDAYDRMVEECINKGHSKTYTDVCTHKTESECRCPFNLNILDEKGRFDFYPKQIMRLNKGIYKPVIKVSTLITGLKNR